MKTTTHFLNLPRLTAISLSFLYLLVSAPTTIAFQEAPAPINVKTEYCADSSTKDETVVIPVGTKYGSTLEIASYVAETFCRNGYMTDVFLAEDLLGDNEEGTVLAEYDVIVIGSNIMYDEWWPPVLELIELEHETLANKLVTFFIVSAAMQDPTWSDYVDQNYMQPVLDTLKISWGIEPFVEGGLLGGRVDYVGMDIFDLIPMVIMDILMDLMGFPLDFGPGDYVNRTAVEEWTQQVIDVLEPK
jgi:menaquinone-dependent protoporphyrinogen IX oxidase